MDMSQTPQQLLGAVAAPNKKLAANLSHPIALRVVMEQPSPVMEQAETKPAVSVTCK